MNAQKNETKPYQLKAVHSECSDDKEFANKKGFWFAHHKLYEYLKCCRFGIYDCNGEKISLWSFNHRKGDSYTNVKKIVSLKKDLVNFFEKWRALPLLSEQEIKELDAETRKEIETDLWELHAKHTH